MVSSCLVKSLCLAAAATLSAYADILPPDSHLVPRTVTLVNTGDYPELVFVALEFYPGKPDAPVAATRMEPGIEARISGYKLDYMQVYAAKTTEWPALKGKLGLANGAATSPASDWKTGLTQIPGDLQANSKYAPNSSTLKSEVYEYKLDGAGPDKASEYASLQTYTDGSEKEVPLGATALRAPMQGATTGSLAIRGRSLIWVPNHTGVAAIGLFDTGGRRAWSARRVAASGQGQTLALPSMAAGRYLVSAQGRGWSQSAWLDLGKR